MQRSASVLDCVVIQNQSPKEVKTLAAIGCFLFVCFFVAVVLLLFLCVFVCVFLLGGVFFLVCVSVCVCVCVRA